MATTYELIASQTLGSNASSVTFSSIPGTYDDLVLVASCRSAWSGQLIDTLRLQFNGDTGSNYPVRWLEGTGSSVVSQSFTIPSIWAGYIAAANTTASTFASVEVVIPNYTGSANKSVSASAAHETNAANAYVSVSAALWSNTSAITSANIFAANANLVTNSSFYLYGVTHA